ncbi:MAG: nickel-type superoxide dismutase maturation protease [Acidimicrobiia bacterium]|nr:nickel-type superoxide dismutase maturation protease [Acidimicrobiia bacterium]
MVPFWPPAPVIVSRAVIRAIGEGWAWILGRRRRIRVTGTSMAPTLAAGEFVLVDPHRRPSIGEVVVARHPHDDELLIVKRLTGRSPDDRLTLSSDNPTAGTDSRVWGPVDADRLVGVVTLVLDRAIGGDLRPPTPNGAQGSGGRDHRAAPE